MPRAKALLLIAAAASLAAQPTGGAFNGQAALESARRAVAFGPRPSGSPPHARLRRWLLDQLKPLGCRLELDAFTAATPRGPLPMTNIIARFPGTTSRVIVVSGHYDTYHRPGLSFVGANDGGSSTGFLLELARTLSRSRPRDSVWLVWLDGEESVVHWSGEDHTYGSRRLARKWKDDATVASLAALINVDMIGDAHLSLVYELNSTPWLRETVWSAAARLGFAAHFPRHPAMAIEDDHLPFLQAGVPSLNLIDFDYGPDNSWWHTAADTPDKLSARSFQVVGQVILETLRLLGDRR